MKGEPVPSSYPHLDSFIEPFQMTDLSSKEDSPNQDREDERAINDVRNVKPVPFQETSQDFHVLHEHGESLALTTSTQTMATFEKFSKESPPILPSTFRDPTDHYRSNSPCSRDSRDNFSFASSRERQLLEDLHEIVLTESELLKRLIETPFS